MLKQFAYNNSDVACHHQHYIGIDLSDYIHMLRMHSVL
jgi:hypothetical protein